LLRYLWNDGKHHVPTIVASGTYVAGHAQVWYGDTPPHHFEPIFGPSEAIKGAHEQDVKVQTAHGVTYRKYWFDEASGRAFCLVEAPNKEAANAVHREAHGLVADELIEVQEGA
jgi:hypothetical protein